MRLRCGISPIGRRRARRSGGHDRRQRGPSGSAQEPSPGVTGRRTSAGRAIAGAARRGATVGQAARYAAGGEEPPIAPNRRRKKPSSGIRPDIAGMP